MNVILLSGGSGKRLWPLSNEIRSKQFIKIFKKDDGTYESMIQRVYRQINKVSKNARITVATSIHQKSFILRQLDRDVSICTEPSRRDTFPAIVLAALYLRDKQGVKEDEVVLVCPVDPYTNTDYFSELFSLEKIILSGKSDLALMGVFPTHPSEKYGYIIPQSSGEKVSKVKKFIEKPSKDTAIKCISQGALWNCGAFAFRIDYILDILKQYTSYHTYSTLFDHYNELPKISFDYAVVEKESNISCLRFNGDWKDVGTWNTLTEEISEPVIGNGIIDETCSNLNIVNELNIPLLVMGGKNLIIAASPDGIFVSDKEQSSHMKTYTDKIHQPIMYTERTWGTLQILKCDGTSLTAYATIQSGKTMDSHLHTDREELWIVLSGHGKAKIDKKYIPLSAGNTIKISLGIQHELTADTDMILLGVQFGVFDEIKLKGECVFYETPY